MAFLRIVEVFQPLFPRGDGELDIRGGVDSFVRSASELKGLCDVVLVGENKSHEKLRVSSLQAAALLSERGFDAAPTLVVRDSNSDRLLSDVVTAYSLGMKTVMLAWGDRHPAGGPKNVYDFPDLSALIAEARGLAARAGVDVRILAPVDLRSLGSPRGAAIARSRLDAGADLLLAQPPTTDSIGELSRHEEMLRSASIFDRVLLSAFPFRGADDVARCERFFGWRLPASLHLLAKEGEGAPAEETRRVVRELRKRGHPGVYLSTRGDVHVAQRLLS